MCHVYFTYSCDFSQKYKLVLMSYYCFVLYAIAGTSFVLLTFNPKEFYHILFIFPKLAFLRLVYYEAYVIFCLVKIMDHINKKKKISINAIVVNDMSINSSVDDINSYIPYSTYTCQQI